MPGIKFDIKDQYDQIEAINGLKWLRREARIFKSDPAMLEEILKNALKLTYLEMEVI